MIVALIVVGAIVVVALLPFAIDPSLGYEPAVPWEDEDESE